MYCNCPKIDLLMRPGLGSGHGGIKSVFSRFRVYEAQIIKVLLCVYIECVYIYIYIRSFKRSESEIFQNVWLGSCRSDRMDHVYHSKTGLSSDMPVNCRTTLGYWPMPIE